MKKSTIFILYFFILSGVLYGQADPNEAPLDLSSEAYKKSYDGLKLNNKLHKAIGHDDITMVIKFLKEGASPNDIAESSNDDPPLVYASFYSNIGIIKLLLKAGADPDSTNKFHGGTALMKAAQSGDLEIVKVLVKNGADVNKKSKYDARGPIGDDDDGATALMRAINFDEPNYDILNFLIANKADVNIKTKFHRTALMQAVNSADLKATEILIKNKANINDFDLYGKSALNLCNKYLNELKNFKPKNEEERKEAETYMERFSKIHTLLINSGAKTRQIPKEEQKVINEIEELKKKLIPPKGTQKSVVDKIYSKENHLSFHPIGNGDQKIYPYITYSKNFPHSDKRASFLIVRYNDGKVEEAFINNIKTYAVRAGHVETEKEKFARQKEYLQVLEKIYATFKGKIDFKQKIKDSHDDTFSPLAIKLPMLKTKEQHFKYTPPKIEVMIDKNGKLSQGYKAITLNEVEDNLKLNLGLNQNKNKTPQEIESDKYYLMRYSTIILFADEDVKYSAIKPLLKLFFKYGKNEVSFVYVTENKDSGGLKRVSFYGIKKDSPREDIWPPEKKFISPEWVNDLLNLKLSENSLEINGKKITMDNFSNRAYEEEIEVGNREDFTLKCSNNVPIKKILRLISSFPYRPRVILIDEDFK